MRIPDFYLCICDHGHSRSVAMARGLHGRKKDAVAIGTNTAGIPAIQVLGEIADKIIIANPRNIYAVPLHARDRIIEWRVGPDRWSNPYHYELIEIVEQFLDKIGVPK